MKIRSLALFLFALVPSACSSAVAAPKHTPLPAAIITQIPPTETPVPLPTATPTRTPQPTITLIPPITVPRSHGITLVGFSPQAVVLIDSSLTRLQSCSPRLYTYVLDYTKWIISAGGSSTPRGISDKIHLEERLLFSVPPGAQPILTMAVIIHESRHMQQFHEYMVFPSNDAREIDANRFQDELFRDCAKGINVTPIYNAH